MNHSFAAQAEREIGLLAQELAEDRRPEAPFTQHVVETIAKAQHFVVPDGGRLFDDELRGLDVDLRAIRLPYPRITVSFREGQSRTLAVAWERIDRDERFIVAAVVADHGDGWGFAPVFARPERHHGDSSVTWCCFAPPGMVVDRMPAARDAVMRAGRSVLELVEALNCNNVAVEATGGALDAVNARRRRQGKLPLYEVRRLVVKVGDNTHAIGAPVGDRNGPREHLRRGHVRRLPDGRRTWVQATVVGARALGVVEKAAYLVEAVR